DRSGPMTRLGIALVLATACNKAPEKPTETTAPITAHAAPVAPAAPSPATPVVAPDGHDLPAPLYAGMFVDGATFEYTIYSYKVDKSGERNPTKDSNKRETCFVHELVFMHESKALSATLSCDDEGPWNGVMFAARSGFWWYDKRRYLGGGFVMDASTKVFDREPTE